MVQQQEWKQLDIAQYHDLQLRQLCVPLVFFPSWYLQNTGPLVCSFIMVLLIISGIADSLHFIDWFSVAILLV